VYAAADPKTGAAGSMFDTLVDARHNHRIEVAGGLLADESASLLREFFRARRCTYGVAILASAARLTSCKRSPHGATRSTAVWPDARRRCFPTLLNPFCRNECAVAAGSSDIS